MNKTFKTLSEPNRLHIVELLKKGPLSVGEIAENLELNQPQTSKHLRVLMNAGLVEVDAISNRRIYKLKGEPFQELDTWLNSFRYIWEDRFDRLDDYLHDLQKEDGSFNDNDQ
ncbi:metalloregulator ArsR/SmtB family transcription factor [Halobacillus salinarum]|uniref:Metalloregulator ArsR/SmtB family transcription factor n=1 Tax=Halobacillus salinarum TaxID=2932257 RepID=A0ABY4ENR7_9BACI|nr:metalloregulator ArsR/SmtB family transcription factor [Halobacillus salinarum]UOQ43751.1 metalloregulator ArsR/SmtB family transcription factor [Halobacillus salinarum]